MSSEVHDITELTIGIIEEYIDDGEVTLNLYSS